jgi:hypothetical protein
MLIEEKLLKHWIDNFYGYGSWNAKFWFIGHEESGGEVPEDVADKINYFQNIGTQTDGTLCDIRELYKHVAVRWDGPKASSFKNMHEYRFDSDSLLNNVWKNLIAFEHGYMNLHVPDLLEYQRQSFLSSSTGNEAMIQLYPLPGPNSHAWYYTWLDLPELPFLKSRALYQDHVYEDRMQMILSNINTYKPEVVLMYGMENINKIKKSIQEFFHGANFNMIKAEKQQIPQHHRVDLNGTLVLITTQFPALRHNRIETGFDWEAFGRKVSSES